MLQPVEPHWPGLNIFFLIKLSLASFTISQLFFFLLSSPEDMPYFAVYTAHFFAQISEGKIRIRITHGHNDYTPWA